MKVTPEGLKEMLETLKKAAVTGPPKSFERFVVMPFEESKKWKPVCLLKDHPELLSKLQFRRKREKDLDAEYEALKAKAEEMHKVFWADFEKSLVSTGLVSDSYIKSGSPVRITDEVVFIEDAANANRSER